MDNVVINDMLFCENECDNDNSEEWIENCILKRKQCGGCDFCTSSCRHWCHADSNDWSAKCRYEACETCAECDDYNINANDGNDDVDGDGMICENHCNNDTSEEWIENCIIQRNTCGE